MAFKKNIIKTDFRSYPPYIIMGSRGVGKTTLWRDFVLQNGGEDCGLLVSFKDEEGYHALDKLQYERAVAWDSDYDEDTELRGFVQIVDDLIENKADHTIKHVCLDTLDEMVEVGIAEVLRQHKKEKGNVCKSINDALGGRKVATIYQ